MNEDRWVPTGVPEALVDEPTGQKLAKARKQTGATLARKLKVSEETVRHSERRAGLYLPTLREYLRQKGGDIWMQIDFPNQPPVILVGLGGKDGVKKAKRRAANGTKSKAKTRRAAQAFSSF